MSHEIDETTGRPAIAYAADGATPWHGLGQKINADASMAEWAEAAGLNWKVREAPVMYNQKGDGAFACLPTHKILIRDDTNAPLAINSAKYKTVQPAEVLGFFNSLTTYAGFRMETAGALFEGRQIWGMARVGPNAKIMDDQVAPYLLLATSFDQSLPTIGSFVSERVVCHNTLRAALRTSSDESTIRVRHASEFDSALVRERLGLAINSWESFMFSAKKLAGEKITMDEYQSFLVKLLAGEPDADETERVKKSKAYRTILSLFDGKQIGAEMDAVKGTRWGAVNSVTQYVDHMYGKSQDTRLSEAWFGFGSKLKDEAFALLTA